MKQAAAADGWKSVQHAEGGNGGKWISSARQKRSGSGEGWQYAHPAAAAGAAAQASATAARPILPRRPAAVRDASLTLHGVPVHFPYTLYEPQRRYLDSLLQALTTGTHALLESPTGEGQAARARKFRRGICWAALAGGQLPADCRRPAVPVGRPADGHLSATNSAWQQSPPSQRENFTFPVEEPPPLGTGKTLCLLCGTLAWQRAVQEERVVHPSVVNPGAALADVREAAPRGKAGAEGPKASFWDSAAAEADSLFASLNADVGKAAPQAAAPTRKASAENACGNSDSERSLSGAPAGAETAGGKAAGADAAGFETAAGPPRADAGVRRKRRQHPTIFYTSRTHSQLAQVSAELRKTVYGDGSYDDIVSVPLGSRDHLCIHPDLQHLKGSALSAACQQKLKVHSCHLEGGLSRFKLDYLSKPMDIEDLKVLGQKHQFCPFYAAKDSQEKCNLVMMPYEYLVSAAKRRHMKFNLRHSVVVIDEGHNIEKSAEEAGGFQLTEQSLKFACDALHACAAGCHREGAASKKDSGRGKNPVALNPAEVAKLLRSLERLQGFIASMALLAPDSSHPNYHRVLELSAYIETLKDFGFDPLRVAEYDQLISQITEWMSAEANDRDVSNSNAVAASLARPSASSARATLEGALRVKALGEVGDALRLSFADYARTQSRWFRVCIFEPGDGGRRMTGHRRSLSAATGAEDGGQRVLALWCFSAGAILDDLVRGEGVHSLVVTSGTLSPLPGFAQMLGGYGLLDFGVTLTNSHVVPKERILLHVVPSFNEIPICLTYTNRSNTKMVNAVGTAVAEIALRVPGGVSVFFSSYSVLNAMHSQWSSECPVWTKLMELKRLFVEPVAPSSHDFERFIADFKAGATDVVRCPNGSEYTGAVLLAVARGRISEGMNLPDDFCRCVVVVGVPHPQLTDPQLRNKQVVLDDFRRGEGSAWYFQQAGRAVNQALGRVVRHRDDYGAIVLIDDRFDKPSQMDQLSPWLRSSAGRTGAKRSFGDVCTSIQSFFKLFWSGPQAQTLAQTLAPAPLGVAQENRGAAKADFATAKGFKNAPQATATTVAALYRAGPARLGVRKKKLSAADLLRNSFTQQSLLTHRADNANPTVVRSASNGFTTGANTVFRPVNTAKNVSLRKKEDDDLSTAATSSWGETDGKENAQSRECSEKIMEKRADRTEQNCAGPTHGVAADSKSASNPFVQSMRRALGGVRTAPVPRAQLDEERGRPATGVAPLKSCSEKTSNGEMPDSGGRLDGGSRETEATASGREDESSPTCPICLSVGFRNPSDTARQSRQCFVVHLSGPFLAQTFEHQGALRRSARCGHAACEDCWEQVLSRKFECPICRAKTRREHLDPVR